MQDNLQVWDDIFQQKEWGKYPPIALVKFIATNFYGATTRKDVKILEVGSGPGANLWYCAREGFSVYALDGSQTAIDRMIQRFKEEGLEDNLIDVQVGDYYSSLDGIEDNTFDAVIDCESLYCNDFEKTRQIVKKIFDKLKKGGTLFSMTFADGTWGTDGEEIGYHGVRPQIGPLGGTGYGRYTTRNDIDEQYKLGNNQIINIERQDLYLMNQEVIKEWLIEVQKQ